MKGLYELKDKIFHELNDYSRKDLTAGSLEIIKNLAKTAHYLCEIIESEEKSGNRTMNHMDNLTSMS